MVALEDNLLILLIVVLGFALVAGLGVALWKPVLRRAWRYFVLWWERDKIAEAERVRLRECRERAETEIAGETPVPDDTFSVATLGETVQMTGVTAPLAETPLPQKVRR